MKFWLVNSFLILISFTELYSQEKIKYKADELKFRRINKEPVRRVEEFIKRFDSKYFGINYDTGNSASLGYKLKDEISYFKFSIGNFIFL